MAKLFDADYKQVLSSRKRFFRYLHCITETVKIFKSGYRFVFVQNPSIVLSALAVIAKPIFGYKLIIDAHNAGVRPKEGKYPVLQWFNLTILRASDCVIVTNEPLKHYLTEKGILSAVVSDPLPDLTMPKKPDYSNFVFVVCSWAEDEPISVYIEVAKARSDLNFIFSGNFRKYFSEADLKNLPHNIILAGFVDEDEYVGLLHDAKAIVDLTEREDCLVCGAYEAISASQKVILSDTPVNRELFGNAAFYTKNNSGALNRSIDEALLTNAADNITQFKMSYNSRLDRAKSNVLSTLEST
ncbi:glycosyltransferase [Salinimonas sp. HHU 13199]|uniref:Glycosyltransferase n=1 Tax=Salinimonas profundi TaxID=2729140 RepID=A0ABR8LRS7_9ALTE|nr:glycosyltransferase [Salinimonas profundi]MBD3586644.1 glycosyltransferase [Salinimonas profundi]